jgi:hypothetical protein
MNLYLHGIEPEIGWATRFYEVPDFRRFDVVLTNLLSAPKARISPRTGKTS